MEPRTRSLIIGALRRVWGRHPTRIAVLKAAEIREWLPLNLDGSKPKRPRVFYICAICGERGKSNRTAEYPKVHVDHLEPVIPLDGTTPSWDEIIKRMFTTPDNLQVVCEHCHSDKTQAENKLRREAKKDHAEVPRSTGRQRKPASKRAS
jgi:5-methylcytosine-specific restriction endonuclease McrA